MVGHVIVRTCPNKVSQHVRLSVCVLVGQEGRRKKKSAARRPRVASWLANSLLSVLIKRSGSTDPFSLLLLAQGGFVWLHLNVFGVFSSTGAGNPARHKGRRKKKVLNTSAYLNLFHGSTAKLFTEIMYFFLGPGRGNHYSGISIFMMTLPDQTAFTLLSY